eukprot:scaffold2105_cov62-Phaeocystis_antarctica.AAC.5
MAKERDVAVNSRVLWRAWQNTSSNSERATRRTAGPRRHPGHAKRKTYGFVVVDPSSRKRVPGRHQQTSAAPYSRLHTTGGEIGGFGGGSLEPQQQWLSAQWAGRSLGVPRCPESPGAP